ncbi:MAG TPA: gentisate 1,2-dioxygenase [Bryobacteraceae bacterium]|nr:gentisate 1,2-dioxygenase [Acidobacteriaceae bacterium]
MTVGATFHERPGISEARSQYYGRLAEKSARPLWEVLSSLVTPVPRDRTNAAIWRYREMRPLISEGAALITPEEAERRVLILENPGLPGSSQITQTLYAGLQMIAPGEIAPSHRHVASALRYVMEGEGAYTAVNGERTVMRPGDFILTPSWQWHDHGNPGGSEVVWLDGLDIPIANFFCTSFAQHHPQTTQPVDHRAGDALHRFGMGLLPLEYKLDGISAPVFAYPFERSQGALQHLQESGQHNAWHGIKLQYSNPATGGSPMPTISAFLQLLPAGFQGKSYRSTDATVFCVSSGHGRTFVGDTELAWETNDVFVVPSWQPVRHEGEEESILFSFSDRVAQKALGIWREEYLEAGQEPAQANV